MPCRDNDLQYAEEVMGHQDVDTLLTGLISRRFELRQSHHTRVIPHQKGDYLWVTFQSGYHGKAVMDALNNFNPTEEVHITMHGARAKFQTDEKDSRNPLNVVPEKERIQAHVRLAYARAAARAGDEQALEIFRRAEAEVAAL